MMIQAVLSNPSHPEYGVATIPFPIPRDQYAHCMELLAALEIGDAVKADCKVEKIDSFYTVLKRAEMLTVNVEELNYLAKRLDSFDTGEAAQFQAMAHKLELFQLKDLINLTFCCQQATVITDFSDLAAVGRDHYMNLHGGSASVDELNKLDSEETARRLIESGSGTITPYGVVYDNGMKLEQVYDGRLFPCYYYEPNAITVAVTSKAEPEDTNHITWLFLPMVQEEIDRALLRGGITDPSEIRLSLEDSWLPHEVLDLLDMDHVDISELNALVQALDEFSDMSTALDTLTIASGYETVTVSKDVINDIGAEVKVNFAPGTASLSDMEITFALNGKTAKWDRPNGAADAIIDDMLLSACDDSLDQDTVTENGVGYFRIEKFNSEIAAGSYHFEVTTPKANTNEQLKVSFTLIVTNGSTSAKTLESISITTPPTKTDYTVGDVFNPAGMVVTASYSDSTPAEVSGYTFIPNTVLNRNDTSITVSYTEGGVTKTTTQPITVKGKTASADMFTLTDPVLTYNTQNQIDAIEKAVALKADYTNKVGVTTVTVVQNNATVTEAINAGEYEVYVSCTAGTEYDALDKTLLGTVTIGKAIYGDCAAAGAAKAGTSGTVDLSGKLVDGSITNLSITNGENILDGTPTISGKALTFKIADSAMTGSTATMEIKVTNANYDPYAITVTLTVSDRTVPTVTPPTVISGLVYNGQEQALITAGTVPEGCKMLYKVGTGAGDFTETVPTGKNAGNYVVSYKVVGNDEYADVAQTTLPWVAIAQKKVTIRPQSFTITKGNAIPEFKLEFVGLVNDDTLMPSKTPTFRCLKELTSTEEVTNSSVPGQYPIQWMNSNDIDFNDGTNYQLSKETIGKLTIQAQSSGGSSSGGGGSSSGSSSSSGGGSSSDRDNSGSTGKVETTTKPDGTKVQTEIKKDGTKVETTTAKDGSTSKTTTNPNGSSVTETKAADGSTGTVKTDKSGQTTAETALSSKAIEDAKKNGEPVKAPVEVEATRNSNTAPVVNIEVPKSAGETKVEIPVTNVKPGTVAVLVHPDGTEEIIKNSVPTEDGIQLTVNGGVTVKIVDNSKDFIDTREHWSRDQVNFVAARELFQGVGDNQFGVGRPMTRGMVNTVLARLASVDTTPATGQNWYDKGIAWARENGVSDGTNPNGNVIREQLAAMLYRYAGSPAVSGSLPFSDADSVSDYAQNALIWATQNGILNGYGDGRIGPKANAERAQVAAMMARFIQNAQ